MNLHRTLFYLLTKPNIFKFPFTPLSRFIYWQLAYRLGKKKVIFSLPTGSKMQLKPHQFGASNFYYYGLPDYNEQQFMIHNLEAGDLFIDIGANVGGWSLLASGTGASILAVEPIPLSYKALKENIALNENARIECYQLGVSDNTGSLQFSIDKDVENQVVNENYSGLKLKIHVDTLDNILGSREPSLIKIDVEGHELQVLKGARKVLEISKLKALILETFRSAENYDRVKMIDDYLEKFGFMPVDYKPGKNEINHSRNKLTEEQNTIYVNIKNHQFTNGI